MTPLLPLQRVKTLQGSAFAEPCELLSRLKKGGLYILAVALYLVLAWRGSRPRLPAQVICRRGVMEGNRDGTREHWVEDASVLLMQTTTGALKGEAGLSAPQ